MNIPKFLSRLLTPSKHVDPAVAAVETPVLDAAKTALAPITHIADPLAELEAGVESLADAYAAKIGGGAGVTLTPAINMALDFGFQAASHALASKLQVTSPTAPTA